MSEARRILIVDDEIHMRTTLADILGEEGFEVDTVGDGLAAVAMCEQRDYSVVLLDLRVPGIDGVETFRRLRRRNGQLRVVLMSAYGRTELRQAILEEGAMAFLGKPLVIDELIDLVRGVHDSSVLVVSGDEGLCGQARATLRQGGYRVSVCRTPHDALELADQIRFDVVLIDVQQSGMTGLDLYLSLRRLCPAAVMVMLSDSGEESRRLAREAVRRTAYALLDKPLDTEQLGGLMARITRQRVSQALCKPAPGVP